ncbi:DUF4173 domain-containing protein [Ruminococcus sp. NK3A76]|uniref:DUF4153 domain-containing protein n=1 Tax=Ruminococcus sp. NK3A76 TaxID=877411 RepID=UPI00068A5EED|nr:DUF4173 domain-containing protein [Ruminococcus sp. NK3A76]
MFENTPDNGQQPNNGQNTQPENQANANVQQGQYSNLIPGYNYGQAVYAAGNAQYTAKPQEQVVFSRPEKIFAFASAGLSFMFVHFVLWNTSGFFTTMFYMMLFTAISVFLKKTGHTFKASHKVWLAVMMIFSAAFSVTANEFIKGLDVVFLILGGAYLVYSVTTGNEMFGRFAPFEFFKCTLENPFSHFGKEFNALNSSVKATKTGTNFKAIFLGLMFAVPLTVVVAVLLMSADKGVENMLGSIAKMVNVNNAFSLAWKTAVTVPVSGYLFGMLYSHTHPEKTPALSEDACETKIRKIRLVTNIAVYSAVTPICLLYVMFFISQANYFLSAFNNTLPKNYSYAEYARRGFFELFAIMLINAGVIFFINFFAKKTGEEKPLTLKVYSVVISVFTLLISATAISKMVMYISNYGLTQLRVYTTWFMILTAFIFVFIIIRQFRSSFPIVRAAAVTFTLMFTVLCFSRPDAVIARYNLENCQNTINFRDIVEMTDLSADAAAVITEPQYRELINRKYDDINADKKKIYSNHKTGCEFLADRAETKLDRSAYNSFNLSALKVRSNID